MGYRQTVQDVAEHSMKAAVEKVTEGEVKTLFLNFVGLICFAPQGIITDSMANAFETTVPCLSGR